MFGDLGVNMNFYASAVGQTLRLASGGVMFSICPSVCPSVRLSVPPVRSFVRVRCQTSNPRDNGMKRQTLGSGGQRSRPHDAKYRFGSLAEAPLSIHWVE